MAKEEKTTDAVKILHRRYIQDDPERKASVQEERVNAEVAQLIHDLRKNADLSQKALAELIGTTQSVISRLEDADYDGHSLSMLHRIAEALNQKLTVVMTAHDPEVGAMRDAFVLFVRLKRQALGLTIDQLAGRTGIHREEVVAMERNSAYRPTPLTLHRLSEGFNVPVQKLMLLAGAVQEIPRDMCEQASRFAAMSESFSKLTREERKAVDEFVNFLKAES